MTDTKHTPLPWKYDNERNAIVSAADWFLSPKDAVDCAPIPTTIITTFGAMGGNDTAADVAFIVRACNSHYELVAALGMMLESHDRTCAGEDCQITGVDLARAALSKARGES